MRLLRYSLVLLCLAALTGFAVDAQASIGWAGNVWPLHNSTQIPTGPITVYAQAWKGGVTDSPGQGAGIAAALFYKTDLVGTETEVAMAYNGDVGNNDEYKGDVPQAALAGAAWVEVRVVFTDLTDMTTYTGVNDQSGNPPPQRFNITNVVPNDVAVTFTLCMSGTATSGPPCVIGGQAPIGNWGTGVNMTNVSGDLWRVTVTFPAGSNPAFEYKYKADNCSNWESVGNRAVNLPTNGATTVELPTDSYNNAPMGCGIGQVLDHDKVVCLRVCLGDTPGPGVCAIGSIPQLGSWGTGVPMASIGASIYETCITFLAGTPIPQNVEYKFKKDDCATWESVANRTFTIDNSSPNQQELAFNWDDGPMTCVVVPTVRSTWGKLKAIYR